MDGKWWLEVEADLARDIRETVHKRGSQPQAAAGKVIADTVLEVVTVGSTVRYNSHLPSPSAGKPLVSDGVRTSRLVASADKAVKGDWLQLLSGKKMRGAECSITNSNSLVVALGDTNPVRVDVELPSPALALGEMPNLVRTLENSEVNLANTANGGSLTLILEDAIQASAEAMLPPPAPGELSNTVSTMGGKLGWKEGSAVIDRVGGIPVAQRSNLSKQDKGFSRQPQL